MSKEMCRSLRAGGAISLETAFLTACEREARLEETNRFNRLAKELGIRENDAVWSIVFLLGHHVELTETLPARMDTITKSTLAHFHAGIHKQSETAETELRAVRARVALG